MKRIIYLALSGALLCFSNGTAYSQNYWGEGYNQNLSNPSIQSYEETIEIIPPKPVTELPDMPEIDPVKEPAPQPRVLHSSPSSPVLELGAKSEKIPLGTKLKIAINTDLNAKDNKEGDPFSASIRDNVMVDGNIVMPAGTLIRGRVGKIKKPGMFSKSGSILLNFDHIVTPLGKQITLDLDLSGANNINKQGALIANKGLGDAIKESAKSGYNTTKAVTKAGYDAGMAAGKVPVVATVPVSAAVGTLAGTTVFATKSTIAIFKKGGNPVLNSGDEIEILFSDDLDVPVN